MSINKSAYNLNKAIKQENFPMRITDEIVTWMLNAKVFPSSM